MGGSPYQPRTLSQILGDPRTPLDDVLAALVRATQMEVGPRDGQAIAGWAAMHLHRALSGERSRSGRPAPAQRDGCGPTPSPRRWRVGGASGCVFAEDEDFDGLTLTVELRGDDEAERAAQVMRLLLPDSPDGEDLR